MEKKIMNVKSIGLWRGIVVWSIFAAFFGFQGQVRGGEIETPESHFGFVPGAHRMLFDYEALIGYLQKLDAASPRLKLIEVGKSPLGKKIYVAFISAAGNIENLDKLKVINRKLALDAEIPEAERKSLLEAGKVFVLATLSMHADEVGPTQSAPLVAHELVTAADPKMEEILGNVVLMMVPCHNPDGMDMVVRHYREYKGTKYEGCPMPGVYHRYVGHDNNRDFVTLSQEDNRAVAGIYNTQWFPQVMVEKHQMGYSGTRYFVPPNHDPIAENVEAGIWNWSRVFGSHLMRDMTARGLDGVSQQYLFDDYWPGSTETCIWKNVIGFLTECASTKDATPIFIEPNELKVWGKGLSEYKKSINMPLPWPGGWWRLEDIVEYERVSFLSIIETASRYRREILRFRNDLCRKEVSKGKTRPPYCYIVPLAQHDRGELVNLVNLLREHGVYVFRLSAPVTTGDRNFKAGDIVIPLAQPFRSFIKEVMERQVFPVRHYTPGGKIIKPYDVTSWSLPLHRGIHAVEIAAPVPGLDSLLEEITASFRLAEKIPPSFGAAIFTVDHNESYRAAFRALRLGLKVTRLGKTETVDGKEMPEGSFVIYNLPGKEALIKRLIKEMKVSPVFLKGPVESEAVSLALPRIALVETFFHDVDAGWTRFLLDTYSIPYRVIRPGDFEKTDLAENFDTILFPDAEKSVLTKGEWESADDYDYGAYPPQYTKGIGKKGMGRLTAFLDRGGTIP